MTTCSNHTIVRGDQCVPQHQIQSLNCPIYKELRVTHPHWDVMMLPCCKLLLYYAMTQTAIPIQLHSRAHQAILSLRMHGHNPSKAMFPPLTSQHNYLGSWTDLFMSCSQLNDDVVLAVAEVACGLKSTPITFKGSR